MKPAARPIAIPSSARQRVEHAAALERFARSIDQAISLSSREMSANVRAKIREQSVIDAELLDAAIRVIEHAFEQAGRAFSTLDIERRAHAIAFIYRTLVQKPRDAESLARRVQIILSVTA